ncbi:hypothetical protein BGZ57DRAFT_288963 [Hyaloscypha finlandica]|nr:hypothetical protein BGZ57DRAFT_288963 [Hyaloscypha finlandica]
MHYHETLISLTFLSLFLSFLPFYHQGSSAYLSLSKIEVRLTARYTRSLLLRWWPITVLPNISSIMQRPVTTLDTIPNTSSLGGVDRAPARPSIRASSCLN